MKPAKRAAYAHTANLIEEYLAKPAHDHSEAFLAELRKIHDKLQMKAEPDRIVPAMSLDELEQLGGTR